MIWRWLAACRRFWWTLRDLQRGTGFSREWHATIDRASWTTGVDGPSWRADKLDYETWKPGRLGRREERL